MDLKSFNDYNMYWCEIMIKFQCVKVIEGAENEIL